MSHVPEKSALFLTAWLCSCTDSVFEDSQYPPALTGLRRAGAQPWPMPGTPSQPECWHSPIHSLLPLSMFLTTTLDNRVFLGWVIHELASLWCFHAARPTSPLLLLYFHPMLNTGYRRHNVKQCRQQPHSITQNMDNCEKNTNTHTFSLSCLYTVDCLFSSEHYHADVHGYGYVCAWYMATAVVVAVFT